MENRKYLRDSLNLYENIRIFDGFSSIHSIGYSLIALQQMNLYYKYPSIVWNTACLIVDSCGDEDNEDNKSQDYGATAIAIGNLIKNNVKVLLPDINKSEFEFIPDVENNVVRYGIKSITGLNDEYTALLLEERKKQPFTSIEDFMERVPSVKKQMINLVKSGIFDSLYPTKSRQEIMYLYLGIEVKKTFTEKKNLTIGDLAKIIDIGLLTKEYEKYVYHYNFVKEVTSKQYFYKKEKNKSFHLIKYNDLPFYFFENNYKNLLEENVDYMDIDEGILFKKSSLEKKYKELIQEIISLITTEQFIAEYNEKCYNRAIADLYQKYCQGTISTWEFDSLCYYSQEHELSNVNQKKYGIVNFFDLSTEPEIIGYFDNQAPRYKLYRIMGTVIDKDKTRHMVTLSTPTGVVTVKFYDFTFNQYNSQLSIKNAEGKKQVLEKSWFSRGTLLLITGMRREDNFVAKRYKDSVFSNVLSKINGITDIGDLVLQTERMKNDKNMYTEGE